MSEFIVVFDPSNEPYLGRDAVLVFDQAITAAMGANSIFAKQSYNQNLSSIQKVATQVVPHGFSIALSIRELVRQGYLLSGEVLLRPLIERVALLVYLQNNVDKISLWEQGWPHKQRPSLKTMLAEMAKGSSIDFSGTIKAMIDDYNSVIHADLLGQENTRGLMNNT